MQHDNDIVSTTRNSREYVGEMSAQDVKESMFNETNQRIEILMPDDDSFERLEQLMGSNVEYRKEFVFSGAIDFTKIVD